jgi:hypothetical protein
LIKRPDDRGGQTLVDEYVIVVKRVGPLAPPRDADVRALDPKKCYDIVITVGYGLA